jgi:hypothetical protein
LTGLVLTNARSLVVGMHCAINCAPSLLVYVISQEHHCIAVAGLFSYFV